MPDRRLAWATTVAGDATGSSAYHGCVITPTADGCHVLTGYRADELIGNRIVAYIQLIHPQDRVRVARELQRGAS